MINHIHGARWWKFDFHNHTPKSNDFGKGDTLHMAISPEDWLMMYMENEIDCVAVTDHNSGEWIDTLKTALSEMDISKPAGYRKLYLFPGVEISASGNIHILALFDPSADTKKVQALLGAVGFPSDQFGTSDAVTDKTVEVVINEIHKAGGIAIPAHVDKPSGLFREQRGNTLKQTISSEGLLAVELIDKEYAKPDIYKQSKLDLTEVIGSDSHIKAQVGTNYTWVKMGEPSLDALKLALHDREDGIIRKDEITVDPNFINNRYFIKSISVENGFKAGNRTPLDGKFSPWLTSIIGGRGTGKSTIINYLRIALARTIEMPDEVKTEFAKFNKIGEKNSTGMLRDNTTIKVEIFKDGKLHLITWSNQTYTIQTWDNVLMNWNAAATVSNISELFPIQIFSQKELYALTGNPSKLIELIDSQFDKQAWTEAKENLINKWLADRATERTLIKAISEESNLQAQLNSTNDKILLYESSDYKETLNKFNQLNSVNKFFADVSTDMAEFISELENIEKTVPKIESTEELNDVIVGETSAFLQTMNTTLLTVTEKLSEVITLVSDYKNLSDQFNTLPWFSQFESAKQDYESIIDKIQALGNETYEVLIQRRDSLNDKLNSIATKKETLQTLQQELQNLYNLIIEKEKELRIKRIEIINRWKEFDQSETPFLIIELHPMADAENANASFRKLLRKEGVVFSNYIYSPENKSEKRSGLIAKIIDEPKASRWEKREAIINEFISSSRAATNGLDNRLAEHIDSLKANTPEDIDRLMVWVAEDKLVLKFKKQGKEEDIETGSAGERTAGMLGLLLALNNIPLVIDQPEDDLDSRLISNFVVPGFKTLKQTRQLILVTHNPNIAVNANSDNMVHMNFISGQIIVEGNDALQNKDIRLAVCDVMEGGRDALNKRYFRISKALK